MAPIDPFAHPWTAWPVAIPPPLPLVPINFDVQAQTFEVEPRAGFASALIIASSGQIIGSKPSISPSELRPFLGRFLPGFHLPPAPLPSMPPSRREDRPPKPPPSPKPAPPPKRPAAIWEIPESYWRARFEDQRKWDPAGTTNYQSYKTTQYALFLKGHFGVQGPPPRWWRTQPAGFAPLPKAPKPTVAPPTKRPAEYWEIPYAVWKARFDSERVWNPAGTTYFFGWILDTIKRSAAHDPPLPGYPPGFWRSAPPPPMDPRWWPKDLRPVSPQPPPVAPSPPPEAKPPAVAPPPPPPSPPPSKPPALPKPQTPPPPSSPLDNSLVRILPSLIRYWGDTPAAPLFRPDALRATYNILHNWLSHSLLNRGQLLDVFADSGHIRNYDRANRALYASQMSSWLASAPGRADLAAFLAAIS